MPEENKKKKKKKSNPVFLVLILVCLGVIAFSAYKLISIQLSYKTAQDEYDALREYTTVAETAEEPQSEEPVLTKEPEQEKPEEAEKPEKPEEPENKIPQLQEKPPIEVDCKGLKERNPDFAGWLYVGGEDISYPVVHYTDNDYYLHRTFEGTENFAGTLFIECQNKPDFTDANTLIYGHNMKDRSMFGNLKFLYYNQDYQKDDTFWILTEDHAYKYKIFSMQVTQLDSDVYTLFYDTSEEFMNYISARAAESLVPLQPEEYDAGSHIVTLSTCTTADTPERFVVQGILVGESADYGK